MKTIMRVQDIDTHDKRTWLAFGLIGLGVMLVFGVTNIILPLVFLGLVIVPGLGLMAVYNTGHPATAVFAIPGAIITGTGAILFFQSFTGYWESWAYAWTLYGVFLGIGLMLMADSLEDETLHKVGRWFVLIGGISFLGLGSLFIILTTSIIRPLVILALVGGGIYLLRKDHNHYASGKSKRDYLKNDEKAKRVHLNIEDDREIA